MTLRIAGGALRALVVICAFVGTVKAEPSRTLPPVIAVAAPPERQLVPGTPATPEQPSKPKNQRWLVFGAVAGVAVVTIVALVLASGSSSAPNTRLGNMRVFGDVR